MTGEEMLAEMMQTANQATLEHYGVTLSTSNLSFTDLVPGEYDGQYNTKVGATASGRQITGSYVYYYSRLDMQQAFGAIGEDTVSVTITGEVSLSSVLVALKAKYNFLLDPNDVDTYTDNSGTVVITVKATSYVWLGSLTVIVTDDSPTLASTFPNNVLNGLVAPGKTPPTDGGNYDTLTATS
jgi:ABC-type antimicrobial peptide transport system permease subunit